MYQVNLVRRGVPTIAGRRRSSITTSDPINMFSESQTKSDVSSNDAPGSGQLNLFESFRSLQHSVSMSAESQDSQGLFGSTFGKVCLSVSVSLFLCLCLCLCLCATFAWHQFCIACHYAHVSLHNFVLQLSRLAPELTSSSAFSSTLRAVLLLQRSKCSAKPMPQKWQGAFGDLIK